MGTHFLVNRLISGNSAFDMQPDGVFDESAGFFLGLPLGIATLEGRPNLPLRRSPTFWKFRNVTAWADSRSRT
jgi:hypothetical protein